jgi:hypothetical protein
MTEFDSKHMTEKERSAKLSEAVKEQKEDLFKELLSPDDASKLIKADHLKLAKKIYLEVRNLSDEKREKAWHIYQGLLDKSDISLLETVLGDERLGGGEELLSSDIRYQIAQRDLLHHINDKDTESARKLAKSEIIDARHLKLAAERYEQEIAKRGYNPKSPGNATKIFKMLIKNADPDLLREVMPDLGFSAKELIKNHFDEQAKKPSHPLDEQFKKSFGPGK